MVHVRVDTDFDAFARFVSDALAYIAPDGTVAEWSTGAAAITGIARIDALGRPLDELFTRVEPPLGFALLPEPVTLWVADEARREIHGTAITIDDGWLLSLGRAQEYAAIEQLKNELLAAVSHELKTPIATIKAYATTLRENPGPVAEHRDEFLTTIEEQADQLARAVDDLLLAGRVDAQHLLRERRRTSLRRLLDAVVDRLGPTATTRVECINGEVQISCDEELLAAALSHLIDNALKYSSDGSPVRVEAREDRVSTFIDVTDRGVGIGEEHLPYIFDRFYRVERNLIAASSGAGLGLFIARAIVRAHSGSLEVRTALDEGSRFTIAVPRRA
jgi:signal transduction histidine kinase